MIFWSQKCVFPKCTFSGPQLSRRDLVWYLLNSWKALRAPALRAGLIIFYLSKYKRDSIEYLLKLSPSSLLIGTHMWYGIQKTGKHKSSFIFRGRWLPAVLLDPRIKVSSLFLLHKGPTNRIGTHLFQYWLKHFMSF